MTWTLIQWVWQLEAPLFVGMPPAGTLNRCRLYLPARAMHGAVTSELARLNGEEKGKFPDYGKFGKEVGENCRFTYLFPAEKRGDKFLVWTPKFEVAKGLQWYCQCGGENVLSERDFRRHLLDTRPGTAIAPESDSASEGTLRETECINPWWRDSSCQGEKRAVLLLGYVFLKKNGFCKQLENIGTLFVGGDTRYGLGKIRRIGWKVLPDGSSVFGKQVCLSEDEPKIESEVVLGHTLEDDDQMMQGTKELLGGWDLGRPWKGKLTWTPGSFLEHPAPWTIDNYGYWKASG